MEERYIQLIKLFRKEMPNQYVMWAMPNVTNQQLASIQKRVNSSSKAKNYIDFITIQTSSDDQINVITTPDEEVYLRFILRSHLILNRIKNNSSNLYGALEQITPINIYGEKIPMGYVPVAEITVNKSNIGKFEYLVTSLGLASVQRIVRNDKNILIAYLDITKSDGRKKYEELIPLIKKLQQNLQNIIPNDKLCFVYPNGERIIQKNQNDFDKNTIKSFFTYPVRRDISSIAKPLEEKNGIISFKNNAKNKYKIAYIIDNFPAYKADGLISKLQTCGLNIQIIELFTKKSEKQYVIATQNEKDYRYLLLATNNLATNDNQDSRLRIIYNNLKIVGPNGELSQFGQLPLAKFNKVTDDQLKVIQERLHNDKKYEIEIQKDFDDKTNVDVLYNLPPKEHNKILKIALKSVVDTFKQDQILFSQKFNDIPFTFDINCSDMVPQDVMTK